jgi:hypothetical protein
MARAVTMKVTILMASSVNNDEASVNRSSVNDYCTNGMPYTYLGAYRAVFARGAFNGSVPTPTRWNRSPGRSVKLPA